MQMGKIRSIDNPQKNASVWLLTAAICFCPAAAQALDPTLDPTDTATGSGALISENGGFENTADGYSALTLNTKGSDNTAVGADALSANTTGSSNTASGAYALTSNTTGIYNSAHGYGALYSTTTGSENTASGVSALTNNIVGSRNTAVGYQTLANNNSSNNVAIGYNALFLLKGSNNIALGYSAGSYTTSGNDNIYVGNLGFKGSENNVTRIGRTQTKVFVAGIKGVPLSGASVVVSAAGQLGVVASSARYKQDIAPLSDSADKLARLRPVSFRYKNEPETTHYGLIAEEVDKVMPELVVRDEGNRPESVQYQELIPLLLQQWKAQQAEIARERVLIARQNDVIERLSARLDEVSRARLAGRSVSTH
jgi:hypothetical protein